MLDDDATVYKLIGPALIKQDPVEAKSNVETRLNLIKTESVLLHPVTCEVTVK